MGEYEYDFAIVGSGFGGSVAALRLLEKGYRVLMLEKGSEVAPKDFPTSNSQIRKYLWWPWLLCRGLFKMTVLRHVTVLSGVGVGGGSLGYACTHPVPKATFFTGGSWADLADWKSELEPHYKVAKEMLGVTAVPMLTPPDRVLKEIATERGQADDFHPTDVAVYFGKPGKTVPDPYFDGEGPDRTGCIRCGGCMLGCRHNAKNSLDRNYLYLARKRGLDLVAETEVTAVRPQDDGGYALEVRRGRHPLFRKPGRYTAKRIIFAGGVIGTVPLLLKMKDDPAGLPRLSDRLGDGVRTNSEALIGVIAPDHPEDLSKGVAIGSIFQTDELSHIEPVRYSSGSNMFRWLSAPHVAGRNPIVRFARLVGVCLKHPLKVLRSIFVSDLSAKTAILLYMRTMEGTLRFRRSWLGGLKSIKSDGQAPTASIPEATELAQEVSKKLGGMPFSLATETLFNIPTTAHILGGCCMGSDAENGVIDTQQRVFGYDGLYVMDGSAISANPGVNPSLTIVAMTERAAAMIPAKVATTEREDQPQPQVG